MRKAEESRAERRAGHSVHAIPLGDRATYSSDEGAS